MSRDVTFTDNGWEDYVYWQKTDKRLLRRLNELIRASQRDPFAGIGKPEPLKEDLAGAWSRRIDAYHRLVYTVSNDQVRILACRKHYRKT
jgi:toxin YoeB